MVMCYMLFVFLAIIIVVFGDGRGGSHQIDAENGKLSPKLANGSGDTEIPYRRTSYRTEYRKIFGTGRDQSFVLTNR